MKTKSASEHFQGRFVPLMGSLLKDMVFHLWENKNIVQAGEAYKVRGQKSVFTVRKFKAHMK